MGDDIIVHCEPKACGIGASDFFYDNGRVAEITAGATIFLGHRWAQKSKRPGVQPDLAGHGACLSQSAWNGTT